ncbi:MAG: hypothetical protein ACP5VQ_09310, partial [Phycisphaerae bacterium]
THQTQYYQGFSLPKITFIGLNSGLIKTLNLTSFLYGGRYHHVLASAAPPQPKRLIHRIRGRSWELEVRS